MAEKLVVLPEQLWQREREEDIERRKTVYPSLTHIEDDIVKLLDDQSMTNYEKVKLLAQLQQRYKGIYSTRKPLKVQFENVATTAPVADNVYEDVMNSVSKTNRDRAIHILNSIKTSNEKLNWDSNRRLIIDGTVIENTNIVDLIKNASSKSPKDLPGSKSFHEMLNMLGVNVKKFKPPASIPTPVDSPTAKKRKGRKASKLPRLEWEEQ